jgi:sRNA-binding protein
LHPQQDTSLDARRTVKEAKIEVLGMTTTHKQQKLQGLQESAASVETLRSLWPLAFPKESHLIKPLAAGCMAEIAARTGWTVPYANGVLRGWKMRAAYCKAVLRHDRRWTLNGEQTDEIITDAVRSQARQALAAMEARNLKKAQTKAMQSETTDPAMQQPGAAAA